MSGTNGGIREKPEAMLSPGCQIGYDTSNGSMHNIIIHIVLNN
jgi:hypothetical protein